MISHQRDFIFVTGSKLGLHICLSQKLKKEGGGGVKGKVERQRVQEEDPIHRARTHLTFSPRAIKMNGIFFSSSQEEFPFSMLSHASFSLRTHSRRTGYYFHLLEKNFFPSCSSAPLVLSTRKHNEQGILLFLLIIIPICCAHTSLSFSQRAITTRGLLLFSSQEEFLFVMIAQASCYLCAPAL